MSEKIFVNRQNNQVKNGLRKLFSSCCPNVDSESEEDETKLDLQSNKAKILAGIEEKPILIKKVEESAIKETDTESLDLVEEGEKEIASPVTQHPLPSARSSSTKTDQPVSKELEINPSPKAACVEDKYQLHPEETKADNETNSPDESEDNDRVCVLF